MSEGNDDNKPPKGVIIGTKPVFKEVKHTAKDNDSKE